jgi:hypothetical protein
MGQARAEQYQVPGAVICDAVAHQTLPVTAYNKRKFVLWMVVPKKRELRSDACECRKWRRNARQFFEVRFHATIIKALTGFVKTSAVTSANGVHILVNSGRDSGGSCGYSIQTSYPMPQRSTGRDREQQ